MTRPIILDWTPDKARGFGRENLSFRHALHERPMFEDDALIEVLDRYPRDRLGVYTMGQDPEDHGTWRRGTADGVPGRELLSLVREGRVWLNLRAANDALPEYQALSDDIFADKERNVRGLKTLKRDVGLLISSGQVQVFYHFDVPLVSLWQIRGGKRVWVYPPAEPFVTDEQLEAVVLREQAEQIPYRRAWDDQAQVFDLDPGAMVTWRQNAPHRVENQGELSVSLSIEFMTPQAVVRANEIYANGVLRRRLGWRPRLGDRPGVGAIGKLALARGAKALNLQKPIASAPPATFRLGG